MRNSTGNVQDVPQKRRFASEMRRVGHGGMSWSTETSLIQPQDGAVDRRDARERITDISTRLQVAPYKSATLVEPEDARLTGGTRSLVRRLLGLNITPRIGAPVVIAKIAKPSQRVVPASRAQVA